MKQCAWKTALLLLLPVGVMLLPIAFQYWQHHKPIVESNGGWKMDSAGERAALATIHYYLKQEKLPLIVAVSYQTPEQDGKYSAQVRPGHRQYVEWVYELEYSRREQTLTKRLFMFNPRPPQPSKVWVWRNVSEDAIHRVAAPVLALKNIHKIVAYKGGNISDLKRYGAVLEPPTPQTQRQ